MQNPKMESDGNSAEGLWKLMWGSKKSEKCSGVEEKIKTMQHSGPSIWGLTSIRESKRIQNGTSSGKRGNMGTILGYAGASYQEQGIGG